MNIDKRILELRKFVAPEFIFGPESIKLAGNYAKSFALNKVLVCTDNGIINSGHLNVLIEALEESGIDYTIYSNISPNPRDYEVEAGAKLYIDEFCTGIVALGGGSVLDCAKGIGIVAVNGGSIVEYEGVNKVKLPMPPLICIPTTAGTSADVSQFAIINNTNLKYKLAIISKAVVPDLSLIDPVLLLTMDEYLTACTGLDALCHAFEAYVSVGSSPITDLFALEAVKILTENLEKSILNPADLEIRSSIMMASLQAGLAFSNASLGCVHALAHSLGGYKDMPHGECNAILFDKVIDYNYEFASNKYDDLAKIMGVNFKSSNPKDRKNDLIKRIIDLKQSVGIKNNLADKGVVSEDLIVLATKAINDPCNVTNPRIPTVEDLRMIYDEAM